MKIQDARLIKSLLILWISNLNLSESLPFLEEDQNEATGKDYSTVLTTNEPTDTPQILDQTLLTGNTIMASQDEAMPTSNVVEEDLNVKTDSVQLRETPCEVAKDCRNIDGSFCNKNTGLCDCRSDHPITDSLDCFPESKIGEFCHYDAQCVRQDSQSRCDSTLHICQCQPRFVVKESSSKKGWCVENDKELNMKIGSYMDPALFGIMGGLALMFIIICVVLQLFSRAQFRENRTIFNTPNPRLMNVSLMKDSKLFAQVSKRKSSKYRNSIMRAQSSERAPESINEDEMNQGRGNEARPKNQMESNSSASQEMARVTVESSA